MKALFFLLVAATVGFAACGGNVVVDPASVNTTSSTASGDGGASSSSAVVGTAVGTTNGNASTAVGTTNGTGGAIASPVGSTVGVGGASGVPDASAPCSQTCNDTLNPPDPSSIAPPPCGGVALQDYDALIECACSPTKCITECGANLCTHLEPTSPCFSCLMGACPAELTSCLGN